MRKIQFSVYVILIILIFYSCLNQGQPNLPSKWVYKYKCDTLNFKNGQTIYTKECGACHSLNFNMIGPSLRIYVDTSLNIVDSFKLHNKMHKDIYLTDTDILKIQSYFFCSQCGQRE